MRRFGWIAVIMLAIMLAPGTLKAESNKVVSSRQVMTEAQKAVAMLESYFQEQGAVHRTAAEVRLARFERRAALLKVKINKMEGQGKTNLEKELAAFTEKIEALKQNLAKMKSAPDHDVEKVIATVTIAVNELENMFDKILASL